MNELDGVIKEFLLESYENLDQLDRDLVMLEKDPRDAARLASVFRTVHTIKGSCGFFGFSRLGAVAHAGENLLGLLRDGRLLLDPTITTGLLALVDAVRGMLAHIENSGQEGDGDYTALIDHIRRLQQPPGDKEQDTPPPVIPSPVAPPPEEPAEDAAAAAEVATAGVCGGTIRVDVGLLDKLMDLISELVLARNQLLQFAASQRDVAFVSTSHRLNLITTALQEGVMKTRMQPIGNVFKPLPRLVRDVALATGKQVRLEQHGEGTELDKTLLEAIKGPLTHLVRNAIDHGIEPPEVRRARGKPACGLLCLRAFHEGGQVNVELSDDGKGIDLERLKAKALERGLVAHDRLAGMSDRELLQLIFLPGLSTSERVTSVSGRGVGMDVVKTNIEEVRGTVDVHSRPGEGTTVRVKIPLTLAIVPALIVSSGPARYAIPQVSLLELVRLEGRQALKGIERIHDTPVYRRRGSLLPLVYLGRELSGADAPSQADVVNIVVLRADDRPFGLVVDAVHDTEEIVVKPLGKLLRGIPLFSGATILGDGRVALILDVLSLARNARVVSEARHQAAAEKEATPDQDNRTALLLLGLGQSRLALPLHMVSRLEEFPASAVERASGQEVVQYRAQLLPLIRLAHLFPAAGAEPPAANDRLQVVVCSQQGRSVGLVVDRILDAVETTLDVQHPGQVAGILGSAVIQQRVTDLLDVHEVIRSVHPSFFDLPAATTRA